MFSKKDLKRLIIPLVVEQILAVMVGMVDTIMIASNGEAAIAGISLVDMINILIIGLFSALATGGAVVAAQYIGQKEIKKASLAANQLFLVVGIGGIVVAALTILLNKQLLALIYGDVEVLVMKHARTYFYITAISFPFIAIYNAGASLFRSMGNSKISMIVSIWMNVINIVGNAILIYIFDIGVIGAGIATLGSRIIAAIIVTTRLRNESHIIHIDKNLRFGYEPRIIRRILRIGLPNGLENSIFQLGKILVSGLIAAIGTTAITANSVANTIASFEVIPASAIGLAMITVVGQCIGAGSQEEAKEYTKKLMKYAYIALIGLNIIVILCMDGILSLYNLSEETRTIAKQLTMYHSICCMLIWPSSFSLPNALRAANDVKFTMFISIASMWIWRIAFSYVLVKAFHLGVLGVWIAMTIDWTFRASCFIIRFKKGGWKKHAVMD